MPKPTVLSTAKRPAVSDQNTEESLRIFESRMNTIESLVKPGVTTPSYDDSLIKNQVQNLRRDFEEYKATFRATAEAIAGDTYASYFKVTYSGTGANVAVGDGYILFPGTTGVTGFNLAIALTNGTHYIYVHVSEAAGVWNYQFYEGTTVPEVDEINGNYYYIIAQVDVVDSAIDGDTIIQHNFGELHNTPGVAGDSYSTPYKVARTAALNAYVSAGRLITGTTTTTLGSATKTLSATAGTHYLYYEVSGSSGIVTALQEATSYPANTDTHERFVLAEITVADSAITAIKQTQNSNFHSTRLWD